MFIKKLIFAIVFGIPFFSLWYVHPLVFAGLVLAIGWLAAQEAVGMMTQRAKPTLMPRLLITAGSLLLFLPLVVPERTPWTLAEGLMIFVALNLVSHMLRPGPDITATPKSIASITFGVLYAVVTFSFLALVRLHPHDGRGLSLLVLAVAWLSDTFAYIGGALLGRHKLYPLMSPKKTVEGLVVGMLAGGAGALLVKQLTALPVPSGKLWLIGFLGGAIGQVGDLCESLLKRAHGVKDAGGIIPGHGGILDRFDAVMFVAPYIYWTCL